MTPTVHGQGALTDMCAGPAVPTVPGHSGFQFVACNTAAKQDVSCPKHLETWH